MWPFQIGCRPLFMVAWVSTIFFETQALLPPRHYFHLFEDEPRMRIRSTTFNWSSIPSETELVYNDCYDGFQCARLLVPLDWQDQSSSQLISLAIIRLPATVPPSDASHSGSIIINPDGPGLSGVLAVLKYARKVQQAFDGDKHFEILSFDPRGVQWSEPDLSCFANFAGQYAWNLQRRSAGSLGPHSVAFHWAAADALGRLCTSANHDGEDVRPFVSTVSVARDMLHLIEKIEQEKAKANREEGRYVSNWQVPIQESATVKRSQLQYYGASYGTILGMVFASMYPNRVRRMILDSNADANEWVNTPTVAAFNDTDKIVDYFYERCYLGRERCALWRLGDSGPANISSRVEKMLEDLHYQPTVSVGNGVATLVTKDNVRELISFALYIPLRGFEKLAKILNSLILGEPVSLVQETPLCPTAEAAIRIDEREEVSAAIYCSDGPYLRDASESDFAEYMDVLEKQSTFGAFNAEMQMLCWRWPFRAKWRYVGPFNTPVPILFLNNWLDPVAPVGNAHKMANLFTGSVAIEHATAGHEALFPGSHCVWQYSREYMSHGTLPPEGTVCSPDCEAFGDPCPPDLLNDLSLIL